MRILGSKTFDVIMSLYTSGRIEIRLPNLALGWLPITQKPPTIERHIDGFYIIFDAEKNNKTIEEKISTLK